MTIVSQSRAAFRIEHVIIRKPYDALKSMLRHVGKHEGVMRRSTAVLVLTALTLILVVRREFCRKLIPSDVFLVWLRRLPILGQLVPNVGGNTERKSFCRVCDKEISPTSEAFRFPAAQRKSCREVSRERWHLSCAVSMARDDKKSESHKFADAKAHVQGLRELLRCNSDLGRRKDPSVRLCMEDYRLEHQHLLCKPSPSPQLAAFAFENIAEVRISSCALRKIPKEIGLMKGLTSLVLMAMELQEIPAEVGNLTLITQMFLNGNFLKTLPKEVCQLPALKELCIDANQIESVPPLQSRNLNLFTAAGNCFRTPPSFAIAPERLELHGNLLQELPSCRSDGWQTLRLFKAMGNQIRSLPASMTSSWQRVEILNLADNQLSALPKSIASLRQLESLIVYGNRLTSLPRGLILGSQKLKRVLLEANPLDLDAMDSLLADADASTVQTLAIDDSQAETASHSTRPWSTASSMPACVSVGSLVRVLGSRRSDGLYLKLASASQLRRRSETLVAGMPGGPPSCKDSPADVLVVAFAASQGEPEWLGVLRDLTRNGSTSDALGSYPEPGGSLSDVPDLELKSNSDSRFSSLWKMFGCDAEGDDSSGRDDDAIPDFDVLIVCDGRMRWYAEDAEELQSAIAGVCSRYQKKLFIGASMGGYGAMLHGAHLADTVVAFGPQAILRHAILRPPAADTGELEGLSEKLAEAILVARKRGASVEVHSAADTHFEHAFALPLADLALTVHPLIPRAPFARLLDRNGMLWPIIAGALVRLLSPSTPSAQDPHTSRVCVARWGSSKCHRNWLPRESVTELFFGRDAPKLPRPGDWFCPWCRSRNMNTQFFCTSCSWKLEREKKRWSDAPNVASKGVLRVAEAAFLVRRGDWGCGSCGKKMQGRNYKCTCGNPQSDHRNVMVQ